MGITLLHRIVFSFARLIGIWFITDDMPPYQVVEEAKKKWGSPSAALTQLLQAKTPSANVLYASCLLWNSIAPNDTLSDPQTLQTILRRLPSPMQADAFALATNGDTDRAAYLLIKFLPPVLPGLTQLAREIAERWSASARSDDLSLGFYQSLSRYGFSQEQTQWVIARTLVARAQYAEAEPLLLALAQIHPSLEVWWHLVLVFQALHRPPQQRLRALYSFIRSSPWDLRAGQALKWVGDLYDEILSNSKVTNDSSLYLQTLRELLEFFPEQSRAELLAYTSANRGDAFLAKILSLLQPPAIVGLTTLARAIMIRWETEPRSDELALHFYCSLPAYETLFRLMVD